MLAAELEAEDASARERHRVLVGVLVAEAALFLVVVAVHVLDSAFNRALRDLRTVETRRAERHERPSRAARVGIGRVRRVAPAAVALLVFLHVLRVENHLDGLGQDGVDLRLALLGDHSGDFGKEKRRNRVGVHLAVADLAEVTGLVVVSKNIIEGTLNQLSVFSIPRDMPCRKARHRGKRGNRDSVAILPRIRTCLLLHGKQILKTAFYRKVDIVGLLRSHRRKRQKAERQGKCTSCITSRHFFPPSLSALK